MEEQNKISSNLVLPAAALDKLAMDIINKLDDYAREYDCYEYGLPTHDGKLQEMAEIIKRLLGSCR